jgi:hypothetical protein
MTDSVFFVNISNTKAAIKKVAPGRKAVMARVTVVVGMEESAMLSLWCVGDRASFQTRDFLK